jgi:hypothetical protein
LGEILIYIKNQKVLGTVPVRNTTKYFYGGRRNMKMKRWMTLALSGVLVAGTLGYGSASVKAEVAYSTDYAITIPATLNVQSAGWNDATIEVKLGSGDAFDTSKKLTVTAASANGWKLKSENNDEVGYNLATTGDTYNAQAEPASWEFAAGDIITGGTVKPMGIIVEDYSTKPAGTYQDTVTFTAKVEVAKSAAETPSIAQADCTFSPSNGKSTLSNANITTSMEYSADNGTTWTDVTSVGSIASLAAGTVQIRVKETDEKLASEAVSITVPEVLHINELVGPYTGDRLTCEYYVGETWQALVDRYDLIKVYSGRAAFGSDGFIYYGTGSMVPVTDLVDNTKTYEVQ